MHCVGDALQRLRNRHTRLVVADLDNQRMPRRAQRVRNRLHMWFSLSRHNHIRVEVVPQLLLDAQVHLQEARFGHRVYCALLRGNQESCLAGVGACTEHLTNAAGGTVAVQLTQAECPTAIQAEKKSIAPSVSCAEVQYEVPSILEGFLMSYGWSGEKVRLVPLDSERHFENALRWINDPEITQWTLTGDFPISRLAEEEWFERVMRPNEKEVVFAVETLEGEHIGFSGLHQINWRHGTATTATLIGRKELWGKGYGTDAVRVRTWYAFEVLGLRLLISEVLDGNVASLKMLLKAG
jgi:RimJ/RimL family protein N-acetyltransferase